MLLGCIGSLLQKTTCLCIEQVNIVGSHKNEVLRDWFTKENLDRHRRREKINHTITLLHIRYYIALLDKIFLN